MATEIVDQSASHFLTCDEDGWALWSVDQDSDVPLLTFDADAAGEERARAAFATRSGETRRVHALAIAAIVAATTWLALELASLIMREIVARDEVSSFGFETEAIPTVLRVLAWIEGIGAIAAAAFQVSVGMFLITWLQRRWRREG